MNRTTNHKIGDTNYIVNCSYDENRSVKDVFELLIISDFLKTLSSQKDGDMVDCAGNIAYNISDVNTAVRN